MLCLNESFTAFLILDISPHDLNMDISLSVGITFIQLNHYLKCVKLKLNKRPEVSSPWIIFIVKYVIQGSVFPVSHISKMKCSCHKSRKQ